MNEGDESQSLENNEIIKIINKNISKSNADEKTITCSICTGCL